MPHTAHDGARSRRIPSFVATLSRADRTVEHGRSSMDASPHHDNDCPRLVSELGAATPFLARVFALKEWDELLAPRTTYEHRTDLFSAHELQRLCFMRWLYQTGRLDVTRSAHDAWTYQTMTKMKGHLDENDHDRGVSGHTVRAGWLRRGSW